MSAVKSLATGEKSSPISDVLDKLASPPKTSVGPENGCGISVLLKKAASCATVGFEKYSSPDLKYPGFAIESVCTA